MTDLMHRLAAANPVDAAALTAPPFVRPLPATRPRRRLLVAAVAAAAIAAPAAAFSGTLADLLGFSNAGTPVPTSSIPFDEATKLTQAEQELQFPDQVSNLGTLDGITFYATKNAAGDDCFALSGNVKAIWCLFDQQPFPSVERPIMGLPIGQNDQLGQLVGFAADGVARVDLLDSTGAVVASAPVSGNIYDATFATGPQLASVVAYDASGNAVYTQTLLPGPYRTDH
jgi:hypothetical protein